MGIGDEIMASGHAKLVHRETGRRVAIIGRNGVVRKHPIWDHNPHIAQEPGPGLLNIYNGGGVRPYIYGKSETKWVWKAYTPEPGEIYLTDEEKAFAAPYAGMVMVEPNVKNSGHTNKAWPFERWQALVQRSGMPMIQCGPPGTVWLHGVTGVFTHTFRQACAVLAVSRGFVGTEGALHHAAAALDVPAVVLWSEFISPDYTGYKTQHNIRKASGWCGSRLPCKSCYASMVAITIDEVLAAIQGDFK